jgi:host factor-I protein
MDKPAQNIQDSFLNSARKEKTPITIYLLSGVKLTGRIRSFDKYSVVLDANGQEQLIFKHAISTLVMPKSHGERFGLHSAAELRPAGEPAASEAAAAGSRGES